MVQHAGGLDEIERLAQLASVLDAQAMQRQVVELVALLELALMREARFAYVYSNYRCAAIVIGESCSRIGTAARNQNAQVFARRTLRPVRAAEKEGIGEIAQLAAREVFYRLRIDPALVLRPDVVAMQAC